MHWRWLHRGLRLPRRLVFGHRDDAELGAPGWAKVWVQACITTVSAHALGKHRRAKVQALLVACVYPNAVARARQAPARKRPSFAHDTRILQQSCTRARPGGMGVGFSLVLQCKSHLRAAALVLAALT